MEKTKEKQILTAKSLLKAVRIKQETSLNKKHNNSTQVSYNLNTNILPILQNNERKKQLSMQKVISRLFSSIGYNEHFSIVGYCSFYETIMGTVINNFVRNKDFYVGNDTYFSWGFLPNGFLIMQQWASLVQFASNNEELFGKDAVITTALINEYEERNKEAGIKNLLLEWLNESKEYSEYLIQNNLTADLNFASSHLINFYVEKSKQKTWILDIAILITGCLATPNFYNLQASFNNLKGVDASNINPLYEIFNNEERSE